jgi:hypothetical protein
VYYAKRNIRCTISKSRTGGREMRRMKNLTGSKAVKRAGRDRNLEVI